MTDKENDHTNTDDEFTRCTEDCERRAICTVCAREKAPIGRDVAAAMAGMLCTQDCPGHYDEPRPGHLWPGELARSREEPNESTSNKS